jgi:rRNA processing protein Krr1/Pno1
MSDTPEDNNNDSSFLTNYGTHIAAIAVGVVVTLAVVGSLSSSTAAAAASSSSKKKKRNKKKGKGGGGGSGGDDDVGVGETTTTTANANGTTTNGTATTTTTSSSNNNKNNKNKSVQVAAKIAPPKVTIAETPVTKDNETNNNSNNNNKKKKKKNGNAATAPTNTTNGKSTTNGGSTVQADAKKENGVPAAVPAMSFYDYDPRQTKQEEEEEAWEVIPNNKSKKKKKNGQKAAPAAASSSSSATTLAAAAKTATIVSEVVSIDANKVGIIIGPKGATMTAISAATGCKIDVNAPPKDLKPNPRSTKPLQATVVISQGTSESIAKAKQAVLELAASGYATLLQADTFGEQSLSVHPRVLSEIVGPGGRTIQAIQTALNVKITIPKTEWKPNMPQIGNIPPSCKVGIAGDDRANVRQAKQVLQHLLKYHYTEITHPGMIHQEVHVPQEFFHCVIGPRGSEIKHIRGNFKVEVYMPTPDGPTQNVLVVGNNKSNVEKAIRYIEILMERDTEQRTQKYSDEYYG